MTDAKGQALTVMDFGRTDPEQLGLIELKDRLGAGQSASTCYGYWAVDRETAQWKVPAAQRIFARLTDPGADGGGMPLYRHLG